MVRFSQAWVFVKLLNGITDVLPSRLSQQHFFFPPTTSLNPLWPACLVLLCFIMFLCFSAKAARSSTPTIFTAVGFFFPP